VSWSNFLVHVANKVVFSTDVVVVGIVLGAREAAIYTIASRLFQLAFGLASVVTSLLYPAFAEYEGSGEEERQRRLLLAGLRGGSAAALLLALPLLVIPENLVTAWVGDGYSDSAPVLALLAAVVLVHQPVWMLTQYLIARGRQREIARLLIVAAGGNVVLSVVLALTVGTWGVALATLLADVAALAVAVPLSLAPAAGVGVGALARALLRPALPALGAALVVLGLARTVGADTLLELVPVGAAWLLVASGVVWRFGLTAEERHSFARQVGRGPVAEPLAEP
jgi:O-antigen/teichoic acid export membrane protein